MSRIKHIQGIFGQTLSTLPVVKRHRDGRQQRPCLDPTPMGHTVQSGTSCQGKSHSPPVAPKEQKANGQQYAIPAVIHSQTFCHKHRAARTQKPSAPTFHAPHGKERHQQFKKHILAGKLPPSPIYSGNQELVWGLGNHCKQTQPQSVLFSAGRVDKPLCQKK